MALTGSIPTYLPAFGTNIFSVSEGATATAARFLLSLHEGASPHTEISRIYNTAIDAEADMDFRGLASSYLSSYSSLISSLAIGATALNTIGNHAKQVQFYCQSLESDGTEISNETYATRRLHKAVDNGWKTIWPDTDSFIALDYEDGEAIRHTFKNQYIPITFYSAEATRRVYLNLEGAGFSLNLGDFAPTEGMAVVLYRCSSTETENRIVVTDAVVPGFDDSYPVFKYYIDTKCYLRSKTLYFLNQYGGWEWYNFIDYEQLYRAKKSQFSFNKSISEREVGQYTGNVIEELRLYGRPLMNPYYLRHIISSPVVFDEDGTRVRVIETDILYNADQIVEPEVTIQYVEEKCIGY